MFGWFTKKTALQKICESVSLEKAAEQFECNMTEDGLRRSVSFLLLYVANDFWSSLREGSELKSFVQRTNHNVIVFETMLYVWNHISDDIFSFLNEAKLVEDDPISTAITQSLYISNSLMDNKWENFELKIAIKSRRYMTGLPRAKPVEKFLRHLLLSCDQTMPIVGLREDVSSFSDFVTQMYLLAAVTSFTDSYIPDIKKSVRKMAAIILNPAVRLS